MRTSVGQPVRLVDYRVPDYLIDAVELDISLDRHATRVASTLTVRPNPAGEADVALVLDGDELVFVSAELDGAPLAAADFQASASQFVLPRPPPGPFTLKIETGLDPAANTKLMGLYRSGSAYCTQCEAEGFRRITYFLDRPDVLSTYRVRLEADRAEAPVLLANGNRENFGEADDPARHWAIWTDPHKKPCYLFALVAGELAHISDSFLTASGRKVALTIYVEPGREERADYAMDALKRSMAWDERVYGREYDLDVFNVVAVSDFNMGAMENKGLNVFNDKYVLASPQTATDEDYAGIEGVIAHEYFHNWTGNRVTCRDWFQLCLKEGLTVFRDQEFSADMRSAPVKRISEVRVLRSAQFPEDAGPLAHNVRPEVYNEISNFYTATVYQKGAEIIRMLKRLIGPRAFRTGMDLYFQRHDGTAATVEEFIACFADASGRDLGRFMRWYSQAGTPKLTVRSKYDPVERTYCLEIVQSIAPTPGQATKLPMTMPLALGLVDPQGGDMPLISPDASPGELEEGVIELKDSERTIVFRDVPRRPALSFLRGFSAPVRVEDDLTEDDLIVLSRRDSDNFNRWQALQSLATRVLLRGVKTIRAGRAPEHNAGLVAAFGALIEDARAGRIDPAFAALAMTLPSEADIAREIGEDVDPDAIYTARKTLRGGLGRAHGDALVELHRQLADSSPFSPDATAAGRRSLRNGALALFVDGNVIDGLALAHGQLREADNMTERLGALATIALKPSSTREHTLDAFGRRYAMEPLILDKWFALQAQIPERETLERVRALMSHRGFSMSNPNRVRALIGGFSANHTQFNRADGAGFALLEEVVVTLDPTNPQIAARLLTAMRSWRSLEDERRRQAEAMLKRIAAQPTLSPDVRDIVTRSLG
ncbi:MAG: aminopeptidase N [Hyphomicrobiales bacterium]|nr:aminopeptidase N [Hyphomicrobiales bacterium]MBV8438974.1 aminopeptidase N [Hyphomicrobiales bacterium]